MLLRRKVETKMQAHAFSLSGALLSSLQVASLPFLVRTSYVGFAKPPRSVAILAAESISSSEYVSEELGLALCVFLYSLLILSYQLKYSQ